MHPIQKRLRQVIDHSGLSDRAVGEKIGRSSDFVRGIFRDPNRVPNAEDTAAIGRLTGASLTWIITGEGDETSRPAGFAENEATPYDAGEGREKAIITAFTTGRNAVVPWRLDGGALAGLGWHAGDIMFIDLARTTPKPGEIVVAQFYDFAQETARTLVRRYAPPLLVTAPRDPADMQTTPISDSAVSVMGVAVGLVRLTDATEPGRE